MEPVLLSLRVRNTINSCLKGPKYCGTEVSGCIAVVSVLGYSEIRVQGSIFTSRVEVLRNLFKMTKEKLLEYSASAPSKRKRH